VSKALDRDDIQGIVFRGYGNLRAAKYAFFQIDDPALARSWLATVADAVSTGEDRPVETRLNVALTASGLTKLGLPAEILAMFSLEFVEGMVTTHRSRLLGDAGASAPEYWAWGGPTTPGIDVLLLVFARDEATLQSTFPQVINQATAGALRVVVTLDTSDLGIVEQFGFHDGISQPALAGSARKAPAEHTVQPGEFVLGYVNEHAQYTERPLLDPRLDAHRLLPRDANGTGQADLGRNGSYLVFRQLSQDVRGFWHFVDAATRNPDGTSNEAERLKLAAKLVGRWPSGAPLTITPEQDNPALANANNFLYYTNDRYGYGCPVGAHIRRANPRDSLAPNPGSQQSIDVSKRHRLIRRGREYGTRVDPSSRFAAGPVAKGDDEGRGLQFICLCGNLARQFEFIQHTWVESTKFDGLYDEQDPILGTDRSTGGNFTVQANPIRRRFTGLPSFVTVRGGGYFFLPGRQAMRYLASLVGAVQ
jgi:Dyp-type peroxidase family